MKKSIYCDESLEKYVNGLEGDRKHWLLSAYRELINIITHKKRYFSETDKDMLFSLVRLIYESNNYKEFRVENVVDYYKEIPIYSLAAYAVKFQSEFDDKFNVDDNIQEFIANYIIDLLNSEDNPTILGKWENWLDKKFAKELEMVKNKPKRDDYVITYENLFEKRNYIDFYNEEQWQKLYDIV